MIKDSHALENIRKTWNTIKKLEAEIETNTTAAFVYGVPQTKDFLKLSNNLNLVFAYSVLEDVIRQLKIEKVIVRESDNLKKLLETSQEVLNWSNYQKVINGLDARNDIAHERIFIEISDCKKYIDTIEDEFINWGY